jgi:nucleotide-binding universal stress UspA family protein
MFKHLLIPTDGTDLSDKALRAGVGFAKSVGARVTLLTVSPPFQLIAVDDPIVYALTQEQFLKATEEAAKKVLKAGADYAASKAVPLEPLHVRDAAVYRAIIDTAKKKSCDLIFMASHGHRGIVAVLVGSETLKVLTHAPVPVLAYR